MVCLVTPWFAAMAASGWVPVIQLMKQVIVAVLVWVVWVVRVKECPQVVQRQRVVCLLVVPFFLVVLSQSGQRGRLVVILLIQPVWC